VLPIGVLVFPGSGIQGNLADKAKKLGIPVWRFVTGGDVLPTTRITDASEISHLSQNQKRGSRLIT
jgi:hypothetical protein